MVLIRPAAVNAAPPRTMIGQCLGGLPGFSAPALRPRQRHPTPAPLRGMACIVLPGLQRPYGGEARHEVDHGHHQTIHAG